jgi:hypothetical protein
MPEWGSIGKPTFLYKSSHENEQTAIIGHGATSSPDDVLFRQKRLSKTSILALARGSGRVG